jgi:endonuclease/exonuclease/phosphatase family metal-dependent hydrolase
MPIKLRVAAFNLENLDDKPGQGPSVDERIALTRPQLLRLRADILSLQEVNGQEEPGQPRRLLALAKLLANTRYAGYQQVSTMTEDGMQVYDERNLVILSRFEITEHHQ